MAASRKPQRTDRNQGREPEVLAAGGVVWRETVVADVAGDTRRGVEIILVHRPRYDDWSFPKGKLDRGESFEQAALREVAEETGLVCELGHELPAVEYLDGKGRTKRVRYWAMRVVDVVPWSPNREIDGRRWATAEQAAALLTYEHDRLLLDELRHELG
ncbi:MAG TPA: NUDIX hydrolase [Acidimicrobiales bacterium]